MGASLTERPNIDDVLRLANQERELWEVTR
jgi:hypothetical protein